MRNSKPTIFISHIHEDAQIAKCLKKVLDESFLGMFDIFVSSDGASIRAGDNWSSSIEDALSRAELVVALISKAAKERRWIYFECGGAYFARKRVIPVCCRNFPIAELEAPLSWLQAIDGSDPDSVERLIQDIAVSCELRPPRSNTLEIARYLAGTPCGYPTATLDEPRTAQQRGLPIFLVVDTSGSMHGEPIERLSDALRKLLDDLLQMTSSNVVPLVSLISFGSDAREVIPLSPITPRSMTFSLSAGGTSALGEALLLLASMLSDASLLPMQHYKPMILLFTDGSPTDNWQVGLAALNHTELGQAANRICVGLGSDPDFDVLKAIAGDSVVSLPDAASVKGLSKFFAWISTSARTPANSEHVTLPDELRIL